MLVNATDHDATPAMGHNRGPQVLTELEEDEKKLLSSFIAVLTDFTSKRPNMPALHIVMMLQIAMDEGKSQRYYSEKWRIPPSTVSRVVLDLSIKTRMGEPGLGLLELRTSAHSLREQEIYLSTTGKALVKKAFKRMRK